MTHTAKRLALLCLRPTGGWPSAAAG